MSCSDCCVVLSVESVGTHRMRPHPHAPVSSPHTSQHPYHVGLSHRGSRITTPMKSVRTHHMRPHPHAPVSSPHTSPHPHHVGLSHRGSRITTPMQSVRTHRMRPHPHAPVSSPHTSPHPHHVRLSHRGSRIKRVSTRVPTAHHLINPARKCGVGSMSSSIACRRHATTMTPYEVAYLRHAGA